MQFKVLATLLFATLAIASPAPKQEEKGFKVVIVYVDAPDCDYQCGTNTTIPTSTSKYVEPTITLTSTNTKYVVVTLNTNYPGTTSTVGCTTFSTAPPGYTVSSSSSVAGYPVPEYSSSSSSSAVPTY